MANIEQKVASLLKTKVEELGYELYDVEYDNEKCTISPKGMLKAEEIILKCNTIF